MDKRNYKADNIRFFLIFCVVFGHLLELFSGRTADMLYRLIYTFHMPAFVFLTGYFARFKPKKILLSLIWPYFIFQILYLLFQGYVIKGTDTVSLQFTTPHWLLWYLLATVFYYMLIPFLQWESTGARVDVLFLSAAVSLLAGFDKTVGYYMSLSRFFCFLPFFVSGYYVGNKPQSLQHSAKKGSKWLLFFLCLIVVIFAQHFVLSDPESFTRQVLYGSYSYAGGRFTWKQRLILLLLGAAWIVVLFAIASDRKIPIVSAIGGNTLPIFLFHGFVVRLLEKEAVFAYTQTENILLAAGITLAVLLLFGNPCSAWFCKWLFTGHWLETIGNRKKK